jgi:hypothetical protein
MAVCRFFLQDDDLKFSVAATVAHWSLPYLDNLEAISHWKKYLDDGTCSLDPDMRSFQKNWGPEDIRLKFSHLFPLK